METQKVNELEEKNKLNTLIGFDDADNMCKIPTGAVVTRAMYRRASGKGSVDIDTIIGIFNIATSKGTVVLICVDYGGSDILLGDTLHYTINESDAVNNKKILINVDTANGRTFITDCTGENLTIEVSAIGFSDEDYSAIFV